MRFATTATVILLVATAQAQAEFVNGKRLAAACDAHDRPYLETFIAGVADKNSQDISAAMDFSAIASELPRERVPTLMTVIGRYCVPENVSLQRMGEVVCSYLALNADQSSQAGAKLVVQAFRKAYPCPPGQ